MNHLFWLWVGGFIVALASTTIAMSVYRLKASLKGMSFELLSFIFWPLTLPVIYFQQNKIRRKLLLQAGACPCGERCKDCEVLRRDLQRQWLEHHQNCLACHPED